MLAKAHLEFSFEMHNLDQILSLLLAKNQGTT